jgi:exonuclease III
MNLNVLPSLQPPSNTPTTVCSLNCCLINAQSAKSKLPELRHLLQHDGYDIIAVVETWFNDTVPDSLVLHDLPYVLVRRDRKEIRGGGIALFIKNTLTVNVTNVSTEVEALTVEICSSNYRLILCYIPDGSDGGQIDGMCTYLRTVAKPNLINIIIGDFNLRYIDWQNLVSHCEKQTPFLNLSMDLGLNQLVAEPTRGDSILDLVFVDNDRTVFDTKVIENFSTSDHQTVTYKINWNQDWNLNSQPTVKERKKLDFNLLRNLLRNINWSTSLPDTNDVELLWSEFIKILKNAVVLSTSVKPVSKRKEKKTIQPPGAHKLQAKKKRLWRCYKQYKNDETKSKYNKCKLDLANCIKNYEINCEHKIIKEGSVAALFRYTKKKTKASNKLPPLHHNNKLLTNDKDKAEAFSSSFGKNFAPLNSPSVSIGSRTSVSKQKWVDTEFSVDAVRSVLKSFKNSHAVGPDGYSAAFYKEIVHEICFPLYLILKLSLASGNLPSCWKTARVIPIFKKGNTSDPENYRPISLTCTACRVLERIIKNEIMTYLEDLNLIPDDQFGFLPGRSTTTQLLSCLEDWTSTVDSGVPVDVVTVDFSRAFDRVVHTKLISKLDALGIGGNTLKWIQSFLLNRTQSVWVGTTCSNSISVTSGVPQGSVLGPLLFILFISDLSVGDGSVKQPKFADDLKLYRPLESSVAHQVLQVSLNELWDWSATWDLPINIKKCGLLHVGQNNPRQTYTLGGGCLSHSRLMKDLGVWLTADLKVNAHCTQIVACAKKRAIMLRRCFLSNDTATLTWAFKVFVRPILEYASPVWSPHLIKDIVLIESAQRRFTKLLPGLYDVPYMDRLNVLGMESLELRRLKADLKLTFSILHNLTKVNPTTFFRIRGNCYTRGHPLKLIVNKAKKDCRKYFFSNRVVPIWNSLPSELVLSASLSAFRRGLEEVDLGKFLHCF